MNLDILELPELDNSNRKNKNEIHNNNNINYYKNNNNNYLKNINIINEKKKRNLTPIKINYHYLIKEKTPEKININNINEINNKGVGMKNNFINNINITDINDKNSPEKDKKEYYNAKLKKPQYKRLKIINEELEEINKKMDEKETVNQKEEYEQNQLAQKFNTIKNPLKQIDGKISVNNSQSIPEIISNSDSQNSQILDKINDKLNIIKDINKYNNSININLNEKVFINNNYNYEKKTDENNITNVNINNNNLKENNFKKNINIKTNNNKDILLLLKPNGYFFQKKPLKNLSTLNVKNKRPVSSFITRTTLNNNSDNISKIFDGYNNINNINNTNNNVNENRNIKNLTKIRLKPIIPALRSITPFNDNKIEKYESKNGNNKYNYNLINKKYNNSINDINNNINDISNNNLQINYNNDKRYFLKEKKNISY